MSFELGGAGTFEEALEMYGITLFVYALIGHLRETTPHIQFELPVAHPQSPAAPAIKHLSRSRLPG